MTPRDDAAILDLLKAANLVQEFISEEVWKTVSTDLPRIVALIEPLAPKKQS